MLERLTEQGYEMPRIAKPYDNFEAQDLRVLIHFFDKKRREKIIACEEEFLRAVAKYKEGVNYSIYLSEGPNAKFISFLEAAERCGNPGSKVFREDYPFILVISLRETYLVRANTKDILSLEALHEVLQYHDKQSWTLFDSDFRPHDETEGVDNSRVVLPT